MKSFLLDTNHLSDALRVVSPLRERVYRLRRQGLRFACCWPVLCELEAAIVQSGNVVRNRRMLRALLREIRIWPQDAKVVEQFGQDHLLLKHRGRIVSHADKALAALAMLENATLLTTDRDFEALPEIRTENWLA